MAAKKSILVTVFKKGADTETVYGDYNAVVRKRNGWSVQSQKIYMCTMSDKDFYDHASDRKEIT